MFIREYIVKASTKELSEDNDKSMYLMLIS